MAQLKVTWTKSTIGRSESQKKIITSLGLKKLNQSVILKDSPSLRGQIAKIEHLLTVEELED